MQVLIALGALLGMGIVAGVCTLLTALATMAKRADADADALALYLDHVLTAQVQVDAETGTE